MRQSPAYAGEAGELYAPSFAPFQRAEADDVDASIPSGKSPAQRGPRLRCCGGRHRNPGGRAIHAIARDRSLDPPQQRSADPVAARRWLRGERRVQSGRRHRQRPFRHALPRAGCARHLASGLRDERRWRDFHSGAGARALARGGVRTRRRSGRSAPRTNRPDLLPDLHRLQRQGRATGSGHVARPASLGSEGRHPAGVPGPVERALDEVRGDSARARRRQVLDVLHGGRERPAGSDRDRVLRQSAHVDRGARSSDPPAPCGQVRLPRRRTGAAADHDRRRHSVAVQRRRRSAGVSNGLGAVRSPRSDAGDRAERGADLRARGGVGENRAGAERRVRRGARRAAVPLARLLRRRGHARRRRVGRRRRAGSARSRRRAGDDERPLHFGNRIGAGGDPRPNDVRAGR